MPHSLGRAVRQVRSLFAVAESMRAQIAERQSTLQRAQTDFRRRAGLAADGAVSSEELAHAKDTVTQLQASVANARCRVLTSA